MEIPESIKTSAYEVLTPTKLRKYSTMFLNELADNLREAIKETKPFQAKERLFYSKEIVKISDELKIRERG